MLDEREVLFNPHDIIARRYLQFLPLKTIFQIIVFAPLTLWAQFNFEPDSAVQTRNIHLGIPNSDSIKFEFRLWNSSTHFGLFTQLTFNKKDEWSYRTGFENHNAEINYFENQSNINLNELWRKLDSLNVRNLPNQDQAAISILKEGRTHKLKPEQFDKLLGTGASALEVELFNGANYRTYYYLNPVKLSDNFKNSKEKWIADEHHDMANIVRTINTTFNLIDNFHEYLKYRDKITINIIQETEETVYSERDELLFALNPELLNKGNHTRESLQDFSRHFTYQQYIEFLNGLKEYYQYPGIDIKISHTKQTSKSDYQIKISFEAEVYRGGGIGMMTHTNFFQGDTKVFSQFSRRKIRKELRNEVKRR